MLIGNRWHLVILLPNHMISLMGHIINNNFALEPITFMASFFFKIPLAVPLKCHSLRNQQVRKQWTSQIYIIKQPSSISNISQSIKWTACRITQSNAKHHFAVAKYLEVVFPKASIQGKITEGMVQSFLLNPI